MHSPATAQPGLLDYEPLLGRGWFNLESQNGAQWFWSRDRAEISVPPQAHQIKLQFFTHFAEWTGRAQSIRAELDGAAVATKSFTEDNGSFTIPCAGGNRLVLHIDALRPCDIPGQTDTRVLGIGVYSLAVTGEDEAAIALRPVSVSELAEIDVIPNRPPLTVQVEVTAACHLKCVMCSRSNVANWPGAHMTDEVWARFFALARQVDYVNVLGTGEPWMHPKFLQFLQQLDDAGVGTVIVTSGDLVTEKRAAALGKLRHLRKISFSIDSPDPAAYSRIRGQALDRALAGLQRTMSHLRDPGLVRISATVMCDNLFSLAGFPELIRHYGVRQLSLRGVNNTKDITRAMMPDYTTEERAVLLGIKQEAEANGALVNFLPTLPPDLIQIASGDFLEEFISPTGGDSPPQMMQGPRTRICSDPWEKAIVTKDGSVYPCECYHLQTPLGSLATESFEQIWYGRRYNCFRGKLLCGGNVGCRNCERRDEGEHPFNAFAGQIAQAEIRQGGISLITLRNTGMQTWGDGVVVRLATCRPRDRTSSVYQHSTWTSPHRLCGHREKQVRPGELGTFEFRLGQGPSKASAEHFQFVVEEECWLPNTEVTIAACDG